MAPYRRKSLIVQVVHLGGCISLIFKFQLYIWGGVYIPDFEFFTEKCYRFSFRTLHPSQLSFSKHEFSKPQISQFSSCASGGGVYPKIRDIHPPPNAPHGQVVTFVYNIYFEKQLLNSSKFIKFTIGFPTKNQDFPNLIKIIIKMTSPHSP